VLRGGSWNNNVDNASALARNHNWNTDRNNNIGFRVVVAVAVHFLSSLLWRYRPDRFSKTCQVCTAAGRPTSAGPVPAMSAHLAQVVRRPRRRRRKAPGRPGLHAL